MDAVLEVLEDVIEQLLVLGVDSEARDGRRTALTDGTLFHDEWLGDGRHDADDAPTALGWSGHRVSGPDHRREFDSVATHVPDRLYPHSTNNPTHAPLLTKR